MMMPTLDALRKLFPRGLQQLGCPLSDAGPRRIIEEVRIGGSYRDVFFRVVVPYIAAESKMLELDSGSGSWTRAILKYVPCGEVFSD